MATEYSFFKGPGAFSIFDTMSGLLSERGADWKPTVEVEKASLILGDRFEIPYERLRSIVRSADDHKPLVNYFKGSHRLTLKASMAKLLREFPEIASCMPTTFVVGGTNPAMTKKTTRFASGAFASKPTDELHLLRVAMQEDPSATWIVKPSAGCKGKGIVVTRSFEEVAALVSAVNYGEQNGVFAVQRYIPNPMLIGGRKFDIRVWALVAPPYNIYVFDQGSCRTASTKYSLDDLSDVTAHLTNHDLQEHASDFGKYEEGNELWFSALDKHIAEQLPGKTFRADVQPQIHQLIARCLCAAKDLLEVGSHEPFECFQLFGFDLLLDDALRVHLVEINGSPGSAERWLAPMVTSLVDVLIDSRFPPVSADARKAREEQLARVAAQTALDGESASWTCVWKHTDRLPFAPRELTDAVDGSCVLVARHVNKVDA